VASADEGGALPRSVPVIQSNLIQADKRTKASEVAMRDAEPRVLKAEERFRKASIEAAAFTPVPTHFTPPPTLTLAQGAKSGDGEQKLLREKARRFPQPVHWRVLT
jgi:hypothetical protein